MKIDFRDGQWINQPARYGVDADRVEIVTDPGTDFWQRSYYGFRNDNAPALLLESAENFTFTVRASFDYRNQFDQCGVVIYLDSENWFKASIEYETPTLSRLGSVVTNLGYSDWATTDIPTPTAIWYRLSRRGPGLPDRVLPGRSGLPPDASLPPAPPGRDDRGDGPAGSPRRPAPGHPGRPLRVQPHGLQLHRHLHGLPTGAVWLAGAWGRGTVLSVITLPVA